ncbi:MAG TPA: formate dehydrogenase subunit delta [Sphingomonas sp.]|jgi:formate dehydrogenase subunit delta|nr:formate dehydrogenase subunit delta [Sphingomonas sp.]
MMSNDERLVYMIDQIARNFVAIGADRAIDATADHIATFWDPRMKQRAFAMLDGARPAGMTDMAIAALRRLRDRGAPPPQTPATTFAAVDGAGASDAG